MAKDTKNNDWKDRLNVVYSTNPNFQYETLLQNQSGDTGFLP